MSVIAPKRPLRILMVSSAPGSGGGEVYALRLTEALALRGHHTVFATRAGVWTHQQVLERNIPHVMAAPRNSADVRSILKLAWLLRVHRFDVIHAHLGRDYVPAIAAAKLASKAAVVSRHNIFPMSRHSRRVTLLADRVLAVSDAVQQVLTQEVGLPPTLVQTVYNGVDINRFRPLDGPRTLLPQLDIPPDAPVFGMVNEIHKGKLCHTFLEAAAVVDRRHPEARWVIVGDGPLREAMKQLANDLGIGEKTFFPGFRSDIPEIVREFSGFVLASNSEAFNLALIEAMASGVPTLATPIGGNAEAVLEGITGRIFPVGNEVVLAEQILELIEQPDWRQKAGLAARVRAEQLFSESTMLDKLEAVYRQVSNIAEGDR